LPESIDGVPVLTSGAYAPPLSTAIRRMKYEARPDLARPLSSLLIPTMRNLALGKKAAFVPVPLHRARLVERGFNQAALVASELARYTRSSFAPTLLERRREMQHQARLGREARSDNALGAFAVRHQTAFRRVVLVDDVVTTGATARACLAALAEREIQAIAIVALAHASGRSC
jgi:ComF family protein